jgi:hypothetical protein
MREASVIVVAAFSRADEKLETNCADARSSLSFASSVSHLLYWLVRKGYACQKILPYA